MKSVLAGILILLISSVALADDLTGSWFDAEQPGYGFLIDQSEADGTVIYWFDYSTGFYGLEDGQAWFVAGPGDATSALDVYRPSGSWNAETFEAGEPVGLVSLVYAPEAPNDLTLVFDFYELGDCWPVMVSPPNPLCEGSIDLTRLTRRQ